MFEIENLSYRYPQPGADRMRFELNVERGEILSLIGPSGAGKSTLLHLIAGFLRPEVGRIRVDGESIETLPSALRPVSMVFQQHNLFPHLDLYTNVGLGIDPAMKLTQSQQQDLCAAFERVGLHGLERRKPGEISGGQRQRVAIARALVRHRRVLLLDEAFAALGPALRQELIELVATLVREREMAALLVSHQPRDALIASKRAAFVQSGHILALDQTRHLLEASTLPEVRSYLGSI